MNTKLSKSQKQKLLRFQTKAVSELSRVSKNRLQLWVFKGIVQPVFESPGHGMAGEFSLDDVVCVCLVASFFRVGFPLKRGGRLAREICDQKTAEIDFEDGKIKLTVNVNVYRAEIIKRIPEVKFRVMTKAETVAAELFNASKLLK